MTFARRAIAGALGLGLLTGGLLVLAAHADTSTSGCAQTTDQSGDGYPNSGSMGPPLPNISDPGLDILAVAMGTQNDQLIVTMTLNGLSAAGPKSPEKVDQFQVSTKWHNDPIVFLAKRDFTNTQPAVTSSVQYKTNPPAPVAAAFDTTNSTVTFSAPISQMNNLVFGDITDSPLTLPQGFTASAPSGSASPSAADQATTSSGEFTVGEGGCTGRYTGAPQPVPSPSPTPSDSASPSPSPTPSPTSSATPPSDTSLTVHSPKRVQYGDPVRVVAAVADSSGQPVAGVRVHAWVHGMSSVAGNTASDGRVTLRLPDSRDAGATSVTVVQGDDRVVRNLQVVDETVLLKHAASGRGSAHQVVFTLVDDDGQVLTGTTFTVRYAGKTVTLRTNKRGHATLKVAAGKSVRASYAGSPRRYEPATASFTA